MYEITLNRISFMGMDIFVIFLWTYSMENAIILYSSTSTNIAGETLSYLVETIDYEDW